MKASGRSLRKSVSPKPKPAPRPAAKKTISEISDDAVRRATGHGWEEWFRRLDAFGAGELDHKSIAAKLGADYPLSGWWCQNVTGQFERERGRRVRNQACDGSFSTNSSKTIAVPLAKLYFAWADPIQRSKWLPDAPVKITTATRNKSMRLAWDGGPSRLSVSFLAKGAGKTHVAVGHDNLPTLRAMKKFKPYWGLALERLNALLIG